MIISFISIFSVDNTLKVTFITFIDPEAAASHTTSFESNTEPLLEETSLHRPLNPLQMPSYEVRRQTYRNILNWRLHKMEARKQHPHVEDTSFDSVDTADTEGYSTDASRLDQVKSTSKCI